MIEINLLPGSGKKNRSTGFSLTAIAGKATARVKDPFMIAAAVSIIAAVGAIGSLHLSQAGRAEELTERERRAVQDSTRYVAVLRERNRAEAQRDSVQRQLEIIKSIDNDRFVWAHIMDEVSRSLPPYTWLKSIAQSAVIESRGEEIAVGIERAAAFLASSSRSGNQMRAVYTCGGGARVPGLTEALANRLRVRVEQANPLANLKVRDGALDSLVTDEVAPLLMLPIGLALRHAA